VRFNRHAVYLGTPGPEERCPAHAVGRTDAILLSPLQAARGGSNGAVGGLNLVGDVTSYSLRKPGIEVTATWSRLPQAVAQALGRKALPAAKRGWLSSDPPPNVSRSVNGAPPRSSFRASTFTGPGFDTCAAPSTSQMSAWHASPYHAVGVYLGGINAACAQVNLSRRWISHEIASGWHPVPIWVGPPAPSNLCACRAMSANTAQA